MKSSTSSANNPNAGLSGKLDDFWCEEDVESFFRSSVTLVSHSGGVGSDVVEEELASVDSKKVPGAWFQRPQRRNARDLDGSSCRRSNALVPYRNTAVIRQPRRPAAGSGANKNAPRRAPLTVDYQQPATLPEPIALIPLHTYEHGGAGGGAAQQPEHEGQPSHSAASRQTGTRLSPLHATQKVDVPPSSVPHLALNSSSLRALQEAGRLHSELKANYSEWRTLDEKISAADTTTTTDSISAAILAQVELSGSPSSILALRESELQQVESFADLLSCIVTECIEGLLSLAESLLRQQVVTNNEYQFSCFLLDRSEGLLEASPAVVFPGEAENWQSLLDRRPGLLPPLKQKIVRLLSSLERVRQKRHTAEGLKQVKGASVLAASVVGGDGIDIWPTAPSSGAGTSTSAAAVDGGKSSKTTSSNSVAEKANASMWIAVLDRWAQLPTTTSLQPHLSGDEESAVEEAPGHLLPGATDDEEATGDECIVVDLRVGTHRTKKRRGTRKKAKKDGLQAVSSGGAVASSITSPLLLEDRPCSAGRKQKKSTSKTRKGGGVAHAPPRNCVKLQLSSTGTQAVEERAPQEEAPSGGADENDSDFDDIVQSSAIVPTPVLADSDDTSDVEQKAVHRHHRRARGSKKKQQGGTKVGVRAPTTDEEASKETSTGVVEPELHHDVEGKPRPSVVVDAVHPSLPTPEQPANLMVAVIPHRPAVDRQEEVAKRPRSTVIAGGSEETHPGEPQQQDHHQESRKASTAVPRRKSSVSAGSTGPSLAEQKALVAQKAAHRKEAMTAALAEAAEKRKERRQQSPQQRLLRQIHEQSVQVQQERAHQHEATRLAAPTRGTMSKHARNLHEKKMKKLRAEAEHQEAIRASLELQQHNDASVTITHFLRNAAWYRRQLRVLYVRRQERNSAAPVLQRFGRGYLQGRVITYKKLLYFRSLLKIQRSVRVWLAKVQLSRRRQALAQHLIDLDEEDKAWLRCVFRGMQRVHARLKLFRLKSVHRQDSRKRTADEQEHLEELQLIMHEELGEGEGFVGSPASPTGLSVARNALQAQRIQQRYKDEQRELRRREYEEQLASRREKAATTIRAYYLRYKERLTLPTHRAKHSMETLFGEGLHGSLLAEQQHQREANEQRLKNWHRVDLIHKKNVQFYENLVDAELMMKDMVRK